MDISMILDSNRETMEDNLGIMEGRGRVHSNDERSIRRDFGAQNAMPDIAPPMVGTLDSNWVDRDVVQRAVFVGGNACDNCSKTLKELGMDHLECCSRCKIMSYCTKKCQKEAWRNGHKEHCRKRGQIEPGDYMKVMGLKAKPEFNGRIFQVKRPDPKNEDRWVVELEELIGQPAISIKLANLQHIRPEK